MTQDVEASRIEAGNLAKQAYAQLEAGGLDKRRLALLAEQLDDLLDDDEFWRFQAHSLAIFATPDTIQTFRLANRLQSTIEVADRFLLKPLMRAITFPNEAFVLAISENDVRLIEVFPDLPPQRLQVPGLPKDAASAVKVSSLNNRTSLRRVMGSEGQKVRLAQYSRMVDAAIRPILAGRDVPLILAANEPVATIFRSINNNPNLVPETLTVTDDRSTESEIAAAARPILDAAYAREIEGVRALFEQRANDRRATTDISDAARLATFGGIETLLVNFDEIVHGTVDEDTGAVVFGEEGPDTYGIVDEIMRRALTSGARVIAARKNDIPGAGSLAATLRYPL
ncbi:hypothetical protein [Nitrobacter sp.]|uniref:baeRF11 domain-containing protein n=1 Tax=Nitrobacter sp. TaxID=29420 RepID=UPI0026208C61|nr:hypothetical protein [Nitrobacter sp.]